MTDNTAQIKQHKADITAWIRTLTPEEKKVILTHPDPDYDGHRWSGGKGNCGCLVGCVLKHNTGDFVPSIHMNLDERIFTNQAGIAFSILTTLQTPRTAWSWAKRYTQRTMEST